MDKPDFFALPLTKLIDIAISHLQKSPPPELKKAYEIILKASFDIDDDENPAKILDDILTKGKNSVKSGQTIRSLFLPMRTGQVVSSAPISFNRSMVTVTGGQRGGMSWPTDVICIACFCILVAFYGYTGHYAARALPGNILGYGVAVIALDIAQAYLLNRNAFFSRMLMPFTILDQYFKPKRHVYLIRNQPSLGVEDEIRYVVGTLQFDKFTNELLSFNDYGNLVYTPLQLYEDWQGLGDRPSLKDVLRAKGYDVDNLLVIPFDYSTQQSLHRDFIGGIKKADFDNFLRHNYLKAQIVLEFPTLDDDIIAANFFKRYIQNTLRRGNILALDVGDPIKVQLRVKLANITDVYNNLLRLRILKVNGQDYADEIEYYEGIRGPGQLLDQFNYYSKIINKIAQLHTYLGWYRNPGSTKLNELEEFIFQQPVAAIYAAHGAIAATFELFDKFHVVYRKAKSLERPDISAQILAQENAIDFSNYSIANAAAINAALDGLIGQLNPAAPIPQGRIAATVAGRANLTALHAAASAALEPEPKEFAGQELEDTISQDNIEIDQVYAFIPGIEDVKPPVFAFSWKYFQNPASNDSLFHIANGSVVSPPPNHFIPINVNGQIRLIMVGGDVFLDPSEFKWTRHTGGVQNLIAAILPKRRSEVRRLIENGAGPLPTNLRRPGSLAPSYRRRGSNAGAGGGGGGAGGDAAAGAGGGGGAGLFGGRRKTRRGRFASKRKVRKSRRGSKQN